MTAITTITTTVSTTVSTTTVTSTTSTTSTSTTTETSTSTTTSITTTTTTTVSSTTTTTTSSTSITSSTTTTSAPPLSYIFWSFDSNFNDMYNGYNGVGMNGATFVSPGYTGFGSALSLNATNSQYVLVSNYKNMTYTSFTWEMWSYPINLDNYDNLMLGMCQTTVTNLCLYLMIRQNRTYLAFFGNDCWGSTNILVSRWYHFAFVYDYVALTQYIYLNGILECIHNSSSPFQGASGAMTIGAINNTGAATPGWFWTGYIDQLAYVSRAKTASEILTDATLVAYYSFDNGSYYDSGPNKINGTGVSLISTTGRVGQAILFNIGGAYFQAGGFTLLGVRGQAYSVSLWVNKASSASGGGTLLHVSGNSNGTSWCIPIMGLTASNEIISQSWNNSMVAVQGPILQLGTWTHIVSSYSMTNGVRLWINGTLIGSSSTFTYAASDLPDWVTVGLTFPVALPCASGNVSVGQFYGLIDELRVYSRELNVNDVYALANP